MSVGQEDVGVAERPQRDVVGGPGADAGDREQACADVVAVGAAVEARRRRRPGPGTGDQARARGRAASGSDSGSSAASVRRAREQVGAAAAGPAGRRPARAVLRRQPGGGGAGGGHGDLLAEHGADGELVAVDVAGHPQPGRRPDQRAEHGVAGERVADGDGVAVGVEQAAYALDRGGEVAQVVRAGTSRARTPSCPASGWSAQLELDGAGAVGQPQGAGVRRRRRASRRPATARVARNPSSAAPANGVRTARRSWTCRRWSRGRARPRSWVGVDGVDLADRVVELADAAEPAANATSAAPSSVVSSSTRAVCARLARARASGPAPSSWVRSRVRWREV